LVPDDSFWESILIALRELEVVDDRLHESLQQAKEEARCGEERAQGYLHSFLKEAISAIRTSYARMQPTPNAEQPQVESVVEDVCGLGLRLDLGTGCLRRQRFDEAKKISVALAIVLKALMRSESGISRDNLIWEQDHSVLDSTPENIQKARRNVHKQISRIKKLIAFFDVQITHTEHRYKLQEKAASAEDSTVSPIPQSP
jgi:hypothetical protein